MRTLHPMIGQLSFGHKNRIAFPTVGMLLALVTLVVAADREMLAAGRAGEIVLLRHVPQDGRLALRFVLAIAAFQDFHFLFGRGGVGLHVIRVVCRHVLGHLLVCQHEEEAYGTLLMSSE